MNNEESEGLYSPATPKANGPGKPLPKKAGNPSTIQTNYPSNDEASRSSSGTSQPSSEIGPGSTATEESSPVPSTVVSPRGTKASVNDATQVQGEPAGNETTTLVATSPSQAEGSVAVVAQPATASATPLSPWNMPLPQSPRTARTPGSSKSDSLTAELRGVFGRYMAPDNHEYEDAHNVVQIFMLSIMCLCLIYHIAARTVNTILDTFVWAVTHAAAGIWAAVVAMAMAPIGGIIAFCGLARAVVCSVFGFATTQRGPASAAAAPAAAPAAAAPDNTELETKTETETVREPSALAALGLRFKALFARAGDHALCVCLVAVLVFRLWNVENNYRDLDWERVERAERIDWEEIDRCRAAVGAW